VREGAVLRDREAEVVEHHLVSRHRLAAQALRLVHLPALHQAVDIIMMHGITVEHHLVSRHRLTAEAMRLVHLPSRPCVGIMRASRFRG